MNESDFDLRVERVRKAAEVISALPSKALQAEALRYLLGDAPMVPTAPKVAPTPTPPVTNTEQSNGEKKARRSSGKGAKSWSQDRELNLFPDGKQSFKDFASEKLPISNPERYTTAVFWLLRVAELGKATLGQVMSCYVVMNWKLPTDPSNTASQARVAGLLSSAKSDDLQLSSIGFNLVNSDLPHAEKK